MAASECIQPFFFTLYCVENVSIILSPNEDGDNEKGDEDEDHVGNEECIMRLGRMVITMIITRCFVR